MLTEAWTVGLYESLERERELAGTKVWKRWEYQTTWPTSWETYMQFRKQQLKLDMEQQTGSK